MQSIDETMNLEYFPVSLVSSFDKLCNCSEADCRCEEENAIYEWVWDRSFETPRLQLDKRNLEVKFHPGYSAGTAAIRGNKLMSKDRHHYWEVKMITPIYGTDVMVGVGTKKADLDVDLFCSLLGRDGESWGYSYKGYIQHGDHPRQYAESFKQGSLVGVHLDTWKGTLQFFLNRKPVGVVFTGLRGLELYPMACSTAAKSKMRITHSCSMPASLQVECLSMLTPIQKAYLSTAFPGLKHISQSVFADILRKQIDDEEEYEFPEKYFVLDDFDFALIGCKKARKKNVNPDYVCF